MSMSRHSATATQQARRKQEDNLAVVFMGIVLVFLICHSPRWAGDFDLLVYRVRTGLTSSRKKLGKLLPVFFLLVVEKINVIRTIIQESVSDENIFVYIIFSFFPTGSSCPCTRWWWSARRCSVRSAFANYDTNIPQQKKTNIFGLYFLQELKMHTFEVWALVGTCVRWGREMKSSLLLLFRRPWCRKVSGLIFMALAFAK